MSCQKSLVDKMVYNEQRQCFVHKKGKNGIPLRFDNDLLVDSSNVHLYVEKHGDSQSPFVIMQNREPHEVISNECANTAFRYELILQNIKDSAYNGALEKIDLLLFYHPELKLHTDLLYLKAYCLAMNGDVNRVENELKEFVDLSDSKLSKTFYGYRYFDDDYALFRMQKNNARNVLNQSDSALLFIDTPFVAKYFFQNHLPGYVYNEEFLSKNKKLAPFFGLYVQDSSKGIVGGGRLMINNKISLHLLGVVTSEYEKLKLGIPMQLYKSKRNEFGVSCSFGGECYFPYVDARNSIDAFAKIGTGYFFNQKNSIHAVSVVWTNIEFQMQHYDYELSLCRHVLKNLSVKFGYGNKGMSIGVFLEGTDVYYSVTDKEFVIRASL